MANNIQNLRPCTPENARERQLKSAKKRHENSEMRKFAMDFMLKFMKSKRTVTDRDIAMIGDEAGFEVGKKGMRFALLFAKTFANLEERTENGCKFVGRDMAEILKACGAHFDQSAEALGGAENPINYTERPGRPSPEYMDEVERQARELGVFPEDGDADSGNG